MRIAPNTLFKAAHLWSKQIGYAWCDVLRDLKDHKLGTLLTLLVIAISLTLPSTVYLVWKNIELSSQNWYPTPHITVYLDHSSSEKQDTELVKKVEAMPSVKSVEYLSKAQSLADFSQWSGIADATQLLASNPLPAVMIITPKINNQTSIESITQQLQQLKLTDIKVNKMLFTRLQALSSMAAKLTVSIAVIMLLSVCFVIANSIRMAVVAKQKSIRIMKLIGATEGFILRPFLYQGILLAAASALLSLCFSQICLWSLNDIASQTAAIFSEKFTLRGMGWEESIMLFLATILVGWLSAFITTNRYLKKLH